MSDVASGWTECLPLVVKSGALVIEAICPKALAHGGAADHELPIPAFPTMVGEAQEVEGLGFQTPGLCFYLNLPCPRTERKFGWPLDA